MPAAHRGVSAGLLCTGGDASLHSLGEVGDLIVGSVPGWNKNQVALLWGQFQVGTVCRFVRTDLE